MRRSYSILSIIGVVSCVVIAVACEPHTESAAPTTTTDPAVRAARAAQLLDRVQSGGDDGVFDDRYTATIPDGAVLFIGTAGDIGIALLCRPTQSETWLTGSFDYGQLQLVSKDGVGFVGAVSGDRVSGVLSAAGDSSGDITLTASNADALDATRTCGTTR